MLSRPELGLLVKGMRVLGHLLNLGKLKLLLGQEVVNRLGVFRRNVVDLGQVFRLQ